VKTASLQILNLARKTYKGLSALFISDGEKIFLTPVEVKRLSILHHRCCSNVSYSVCTWQVFTAGLHVTQIAYPILEYLKGAAIG
jgi:hypothetical protein